MDHILSRPPSPPQFLPLIVVGGLAALPTAAACAVALGDAVVSVAGVGEQRGWPSVVDLGFEFDLILKFCW